MDIFMKVVYADKQLYGEDGLHFAHIGDAGLDLRCATDFVIDPHSTQFVYCGIRIQLPHGTFGAIRSRSGLARRMGVDAIDGTIDENFRGDIGVTMRNSSSAPAAFKRGDRICQLVVIPYIPVIPAAFNDLDDDKNRGTSGYGSTGLK